MSTPARPSTPVAQTTPSIPRTGTWKHPKIDEIVRRQNASNFSSDNVKKILYNVGGITVAYFLGKSLYDAFPSLFQQGKSFYDYGNYAHYLVQFIFVYNILVALSPLLRKPDDISDIPLTPAQRKLLGLPPSSAPPTPGSQYSTPPRYARTPTPLSGSPATRNIDSGSPLSGKGSPTSGNIPQPIFSPGSRIGGGLDGSRRYSYGSPSPLGPGGPRGVPETPGTPSPSAAKGVNIGLNSKWLYDKGRRNSSSSRLYS